jgi:CBS domain-containing protein
MGAVSKILERKGSEIFSISPETSVYRALEIMVEKNVSALLVTEVRKTRWYIFGERLCTKSYSKR